MLDSIVHRGPDGEGIFEDRNLVIGHRRLAIIDTSDHGLQPMHFQDFTIAFNGEVYNYLELRKTLEDIGHQFQTQSDTEVVLHTFAEWGLHALDQFIGMWAIALYDKKSRLLHLIRDRFGIKPLYYFYDDSTLTFASEIKAILTTGVSRDCDMTTLSQFLISGAPRQGERTFFENV